MTTPTIALGSSPSSAQPRAASQQNHYARARNAKLAQDAHEALTRGNPVLAMSFDGFVALLEQTVMVSQFAEGRPQTKTSIQLAQGLQTLRDGAAPGTCIGPGASFWGWPELAQLHVHPLVASVYMRMRQELQDRAART